MKILDFIEKNISDFDFNKFLKELYGSSILNEKLLCYCILIEIKFSLLEQDHYIKTINFIKSKKLKINFTNFIENREKYFSKEFKQMKPIYSRVVSKEIFIDYIGTIGHKTKPYISESEIKSNGWSSSNGVVWVTPKDEIDNLMKINASLDSVSNIVCDYLGFPRLLSDISYIKIDYSPHFPDSVFQPNSSNRLWNFEHILYISNNNLTDFGETYNENNVKFAKEHIHETSTFFDKNFSANYIKGKTTEQKPPVTENILKEANRRLEL